MDKVIIAPDSFKGTLSAIEVCNIINEEILKIFPQCDVVSVPIADGGEGTIDSFLMAVHGEKVFIEVTGPYFEKIDSYYALIDCGKTAIVEMAAAAGLHLVKGRENPSKTTTYGVGELILHAVESGVEKIIIGLGGSCTNDGGCGLAAALGVKFLNRDMESFIPIGENLGEIVSIDTSNIVDKLSEVKTFAMCDVTNPLYGSQGAAYIFASQKGASEEMTQTLDENLQIYGQLLEKISGKETICSLSGAGAAGGMGAGLYALLGVSLVSGIDMILDAIRFDKMIDHSDLIITGEGQIDGQSLGGKAIFGISRYAKAKAIPLCVIVGQAIDEELGDAYEIGISGIFTINRKTLSFSESKDLAESNLRYTLRNILCFTKSIK